MNKQNKFVILFLLAICVNSESLSQSIKIGIVNPTFTRTATLQYELNLHRNQSFQIGPSYTAFTKGNTTFKGLGINQEYRIYGSRLGPFNRFYVAPLIQYQYLYASDQQNKGIIDLVSGGLVTGRQYLIKEKIILDLFVGGTFQKSSLKKNQDAQSNFNWSVNDGFNFRMGLAVGVSTR